MLESDFIPEKLSSKLTESKKIVSNLEDESTSFPEINLTPMKSVSIDVQREYAQPQRLNFDKTIQSDLNYYSRTKALEINTSRAQILQNLVDKMTEGTGQKARVIIMNKGADPNAFVLPDGSIFISQSLINKLDTLDEVAGVLAHEVGHLINDTFGHNIRSEKGYHKFGVGWIHEAVSDSLVAPKLLEKIGLNSLAFASAITKISGTERGSIHQAGLARASQSVGAHIGYDFDTAHQAQIPLTGELSILYSSVNKTNSEIVRDFFSKKDINRLKQALNLLHPRDLGECYDSMLNLNRYDSMYKNVLPFLKVANEILTTRLTQAGYSPQEITLFLLTRTGRSSRDEPFNTYLIDETSKFIDALDALPGLDTSDRSRQMNLLAFDKDEYGIVVTRIFNLLDDIYEKYVDPKKFGIVVDEDSILQILDKLNKMDLHSQTSKQSDLAKLAVRFIKRSYLIQASMAKAEIDTNQIRDFCESVKAIGINITFDHVWRELLQQARYEDSLEEKKLTSEGKNQAAKVIYEVFNIKLEQGEKMLDIDQFFAQLAPLKDNWQGNELIKNFLDYYRGHLQALDINAGRKDENRVRTALESFNQGVDNFYSQLTQIGVSESDPLWQKETDLKIKQMKYSLKLAASLAWFTNDSDGFYQYQQKLMEESGINFKNLDYITQLNLCQGLIDLPSKDSPFTFRLRKGTDYSAINLSHHVTLSNYPKLFQLPFLSEILLRQNNLSFSSIKDLQSSYEQLSQQCILDNFQTTKGPTSGLFGDSPGAIITGVSYRQEFIRLLQDGVPEAEFADLYSFVDSFYPPGVEKDEFLKQINKRYLFSENVTIQEKVDHLEKNFDQLSFEGMEIIASQIETMDSFEWFRTRMWENFRTYLAGGKTVTKIAASDFLTSALTSNFQALLNTARADRGNKINDTTSAALEWLYHYLTPDRDYMRRGVEFDTPLHQFVVDGTGRSSFKSLSDIFAKLHNLSAAEKFTLAHKALTDSGGALTSPENRGELADILIKALNLKPGFITSVLKSACLVGEGSLLGFPASQMLAPLLFRSLDSSVLNTQELKKLIQAKKSDDYRRRALKDHLPDDAALNSILYKTTREISLFGARLRQQPGSEISELTQESDASYFEANRLLNQLVQLGETEGKTTTQESKIDPSLEAIIKGIEASGALGVRSLQLAVQLYPFPPEIHQRLSACFDSTTRMNKLMFWEHLYNLSQKDEDTKRFIDKIKLGKYLGGGSLFTTFAATITQEDGTEKPIVVKALNPSSHAFVIESYKLAQSSLEEVVKKEKKAPIRNLAKLGMVLISLSRKWCIEDITESVDKFIEDDDTFKDLINRFNLHISEAGDAQPVQFYAPQRSFTTEKLKAEDLAQGRTLNQLLNDETIDISLKRQAVSYLTQFFSFQLKTPVNGPEGPDSEYLIHSDPHIGNYIVDFNESAALQVGVIDRSMYLHLSQKDMQIVRQFASETHSVDLLRNFVDHMLDTNKVRSRFDRTRFTADILISAAKEAAAQKLTNKIDNFAYLRLVMSKMAEHNLDIPLNLRLMLRNVTAVKELAKKYQVDIKL